ncbi:DegT/DnrJ/EryC1/StrS family aminotransferase [Trichothermofontia sp.]
MNTIPPLDLVGQYQQIGDEITQAVTAVLVSGAYIGGPIVETFEQQFAAYIGVSECVACNSGTDALFLALRALGIEPGDEVITTPFTFIATAEVIQGVGATPVFVDVEAQTYNLDLAQVEAAIGPRTKAIIPVHLFGQPIDMTRLTAIATRHQLAIVEDCAQATGATWANRPVGSWGTIGCFSFYPTKNLGACGDGGAITTNDGAIAAKLRMLRNHGQSQRYLYEMGGVNSRLDAIQAAILTVKLRYLDQWNAQRQAIADRYTRLLQPVPGICLPQTLSGGKSVWNQYTLRLTHPPEGQGQSPSFGASHANTCREALRQHLRKHGIGSMVYYPIPLHLQPVYQHLGYQPGQLPVSEQLAQEVLSLPMFPELTEAQQTQVVYALKDYWGA